MVADRFETAYVVFDPDEEVSEAELEALFDPADDTPAAAAGPNGPQGMWTVGAVFEAESLTAEFGGTPGSGIRIEVVAETGFDVRMSVAPSTASVYRSFQPGWQLVGFTDTAGDLNRGTLSVLAAPRVTRVLQWYAPGQQFLRFGPQDRCSRISSIGLRPATESGFCLMRAMTAPFSGSNP